MLIGFTGKKESGKTTASSVLAGQGFRVLSFATPLKQAVDGLLLAQGLSRDLIAVYAADKEVVIPAVGRSYRALCQRMGDIGREFNPDFWVNAAAFKLLEIGDSHAVFDDVRFDNEAQMIRKQGGVIIHVVRAGLFSDDLHVSEAGITPLPGDLWIYNVGSVKSLRSQVLSRLLDGRFGNL